ncbi:MAG: methyltransferase [Clostridia bacterium]|nr:methyltransferase [Clostridia bacterium]
MERLWDGGPVFDAAGGFPLVTDSVLLADFARTGKTGRAARGCELGCGPGAVSLLLLWREPGLCMDMLELLPEAAEAARRNLEANGLGGRGRVLEGDIREHGALLPGGGYDLVVCNPPYFSSGGVSPDGSRAAARSEGCCSLDDVLEAAARLLRPGGRLALVHRVERLADVLCGMRARALEPKRLRLVQHSAAHAPSLTLAEGRRGGRPGLEVEPVLILCKPDGTPTEESRRIYHMEVGQ